MGVVSFPPTHIHTYVLHTPYCDRRRDEEYIHSVHNTSIMTVWIGCKRRVSGHPLRKPLDVYCLFRPPSGPAMRTDSHSKVGVPAWRIRVMYCMCVAGGERRDQGAFLAADSIAASPSRRSSTTRTCISHTPRAPRLPFSPLPSPIPYAPSIARAVKGLDRGKVG